MPSQPATKPRNKSPPLPPSESDSVHERPRNSNNQIKQIRHMLLKSPTGSPSLAEPCVWDTQALALLTAELKDYANKYQHVKKNVPNAGPLSHTVVASLLRWRKRRIEAKIVTIYHELDKRIQDTEESLRLWLEAVVMRKWSVRHDALMMMNDLDASIGLHEYRLDCLEDTAAEAKTLAIAIKKECNAIATMLMFNEAVLDEQHETEKRINSVKFVSEEDTPPISTFSGYSGPAGMALPVSVLMTAPLRQLWEDSQEQHMNYSNDGTHQELSRHLENCIQCVNRVNKVIEGIRQSTKREMDIISHGNQLRSQLKNRRPYLSSETPRDSIQAYDGVEESDASVGNYNRGAVSDVAELMERRQIRHSVKHIIQHLEVLSEDEKTAKEKLISLLEMKGEIQSLYKHIKDIDGTTLPEKDSAVAYAIVWGGGNFSAAPQLEYSAMISPLTNAERLKYLPQCREKAKDKIIAMDELLTRCSEHRLSVGSDSAPNSSSTPPPPVDDGHNVATTRILDILSKCSKGTASVTNSPTRRNSNSTIPVYYKELRNSDIVSIFQRLHANSLRIDPVYDIWTSDSFSPLTDMPRRRKSTSGSSMGGSFDRTDDLYAKPVTSFLDNFTFLSGLKPIELDSASNDSSPRDGDWFLDMGLMWILDSPGLVGLDSGLIPVGATGLSAVFCRNAVYRTVLSAITLADAIEKEFRIDLPVLVFDEVTNKFMGLTAENKQKIIAKFPTDCSLALCDCAPKCSNTVPLGLAPFQLPLHRYVTGMLNIDVVCSYGAWRSEEVVLAEILGGDEEEMMSILWEGMKHCFGSCNVDGAIGLVRRAMDSFLRLPDLCYLGVQTQLREYPERLIMPFEHHVQYLSQHALLCEAHGTGSELVKMLIPLGAIRVLCAARNQQTMRRLDEICGALSKWIAASDNLAFRMFGHLRPHEEATPRLSSGVSTPVNMKEFSKSNSTRSITGEKFFHLRKDKGDDASSHASAEGKRAALEKLMRMRIPLLGSVSVACRSELLHDLLFLQVEYTSQNRQYSSDSTDLFTGLSGIALDVEEHEMHEKHSRHEIHDKHTKHEKHESFDSSPALPTSHITSDYIIQEETLVILQKLCALTKDSLLTYSIDSAQRNSNRRRHNTFTGSMRDMLRHQCLQYILGLDDRWSLEATLAICDVITDMLHNNHLMKTAVSKVAIKKNHESSIIGHSTFQMLLRQVPKTVQCHVVAKRFCLTSHGASLQSVYSSLSSKPYIAAILLFQDSTGHVFGGFVNHALKISNDYYGSSDDFVFTALPMLQVFRWTKRNDYFIVSNNGYLAMGGGGNGAAFRVDDELHYGSCCASATFDNKMLSFTDHFRCTRFEIWTFE